MSELSEPARSRVLLIGAHAFADPGLEPLPAVSSNLARLAELLRDPTVWGLASDHVRVLPEPGRDQALEEVARLAEEAEDTFLVYYAGHGFVHELSNELYLALPGTKPRFLPSALRYQDIRELLLGPQCRARRKVVILDCCWSGLALNGAMSASGLGGRSDISGTFVLTATSETKAALAPPGETYTAFTGELIGALDRGIPGAPPLLTMTTLYEHLYGALVAKGRPTPQQRNVNTAGSITLARNRYREPEPEQEPKPAEGTVRSSWLRRHRGHLSRRRTVAMTASTVLVATLSTLPLTRDAVLGDDPKGDVSVAIGVSVPLSGQYAVLGEGIKNSADLAVKEANEEGFVPGVTFKVQAMDDKGQAATGKEVAGRFVADPGVVGVVGPLGSSVASETQKLLSEARLPQISPANSAPALTLGPEWVAGPRSRPYDTYFRLAANDIEQGPAAAKYLYEWDERRRAYVIDDNRTYGRSLAETFAAEFRAKGGDVVAESHVDAGQDEFGDEVQRARELDADVVYFGGDAGAGAALSRQLHAADPDIRVAGGDGIFSDGYLSDAGSGAEGDICTVGGADTASLPSAENFIAEYGKADYSAPYGAYGGYAYDATWALIRAFKEGVDVTGGELPPTAREDLRKAVQSVEFDGAMGRVGFDRFGDAVTRQMEIYQVSGGQWKRV